MFWNTQDCHGDEADVTVLRFGLFGDSVKGSGVHHEPVRVEVIWVGRRGNGDWSLDRRERQWGMKFGSRPRYRRGRGNPESFGYGEVV